MARAGAAVRGELRLMLSLRVLPARVARFCWRARRSGDRFSLDSAARPPELAELLALAGDRTTVVELGTGTAWSAIAMALDRRARRVISYDPCVRLERDAYLELAGAGAGVRERIELREESDSAGPRAGDPPPALLFIDSPHDRESVLTAFNAWRDVLALEAIVVFHGYGHPGYPGVSEAVSELRLSGRETGGLFVRWAP